MSASACTRSIWLVCVVMRPRSTSRGRNINTLLLLLLLPGTQCAYRATTIGFCGLQTSRINLLAGNTIGAGCSAPAA